METDNKQKNVKRRRNRRQRKNFLKGLNSNINNDEVKIEEERKSENISNKKISSSPRPNNLSGKTFDIPFKRNSGSECEDFQTPNTEYAIRISRINGDYCDYDREWEELAIFPDRRLDNRIKNERRNIKEIHDNIKFINDERENNEIYSVCFEDVIVTNERFVEIIMNQKENDIYERCMNPQKSNDAKPKMMWNSEIEHQNNDMKEEDSVKEKISNYEKLNEYQNNEISNKPLLNGNYINKKKKKNEKPKSCCEENNIKHLQNETFSEDFENNKEHFKNKANIAEMENSTSDIEINQRISTETEIVVQEHEKEFENNKCSILSENDENLCIKNDCKTIQPELNEKLCNRFVNFYPGDVIEDCHKCCMEKERKPLDLFEMCKIEHIPFMDSSDLYESYDDKLMKEGITTNAIECESFSICCTEENLKEETLHVNHVVLNCISQPLISKSLTLKQSTTSMTNVTSISQDDISYEIDCERRKVKKKKSNTFKIYTKFMDKFRKEKTSVRENDYIVNDDHTSSLKSLNLIKDSEIESNQSLKSNNEINPNFQNFPDETINIGNETSESISDKKETKENPILNIEKNKKVPKNKKIKLLKLLLKKKSKENKESEDKVVDIESSIIPSKCAEIEVEIIEEFNETLKSLLTNEPETKFDEVVIVNLKNKNKNKPDPDKNKIPGTKNVNDDHLFPDAITVTKIKGLQPIDVPYIDDSEIILIDAMSFYNGEMKRCRINNDYLVPMASMESLYFPEDTLDKKNFQNSPISQSPFRKKKVFGNLFDCMSRRR